MRSQAQINPSDLADKLEAIAKDIRESKHISTANFELLNEVGETSDHKEGRVIKKPSGWRNIKFFIRYRDESLTQ